MKYKKTPLHWILLQFLKDSLDFLADNPRAKGMNRMDWINEWIEEKYRKSFFLSLQLLKEESEKE